MPDRSPDNERSTTWAVLMLLGCLFLWASLLTFDAGDWPSPHRYPNHDPTLNACGKAGAFVAFHLRRAIGDGVFPLLVFLTAAVLLWAVHGRIVRLAQRVFGLTMVVVCTAASVHLVSTPGANSLPFGEGGIVGSASGQFLQDTFARVGTVLVLGYCFIVGLLFVAEGWMLKLSGVLKRAVRASGEAIAEARSQMPAPKLAAALMGAAEALGRTPSQPEVKTPVGTDEDIPRLRFHGERDIARKKKKPRDDQPGLFDRSKVKETATATAEPEPITEPPVKAIEPDTASQSEPQAPAPGFHESTPKPQSPPTPPQKAYPSPLDDWEFPSLTMLDDPEYTFNVAQESVLRAKAKTLERTLQEFRLDARVVEIDTGPVITMFELDLGAGIKVSQIAALANDIARALKAPNVRIIAPIPGKNTVGVEVPNADKEKVRLKGLILSTEAAIESMAIPLFLGKDASGTPLVVDLASMPHMLIAGTTGSGKSVSMNSIIMSILMCRRPDRVKLILIDPKMVEMSQFKDVPHLMAPIVTDMQRAEQILEWAVTKMDERYALIAEARVRNIKGYNQLGEEELFKRLHAATEQEREQIPKQLPHIVIMIDELADLMMTSAKEVEHHLSRLAQKSRAVGIHIVVATQRPEAKVVTGLIKSNLPCRCAFRVASRMDSRIVLDQNGAEVLMGQGDMLFLPPGSHKLLRAQGTLVEDKELNRILDFLAEQGRAEFHPELMRMNARGADNPAERDPLFNQAVDVIMETRRGSVSLLQRRLTIGYSRASRLIEQMAAAGIVGEYKGSQAREVVITPEEWEAIRGGNQAPFDTQPSPVSSGVIDVANDPPPGHTDDSDDEYDDGDDDGEWADDEAADDDLE